MGKKNLLNALNHIFQRSDVVRECLLAIPSHGIGGVGLPADEPLVHLYISVLLQAHQMRRQVTIRHLQHLLEVIKAHLLVDDENAHDP